MDLSGSDLLRTTLAGASLRNADLTSTRLDGVDLTSIDLTGATGIPADWTPDPAGWVSGGRRQATQIAITERRERRRRN
ncbi:pentapeptide repeat-containing protein [Catenulispora rubra]|uniref:pentapeptide repeat-containing protein n=1 Tax=Catenulispora rubra TaxID=280293 RepID=UPI0018928480